MRAVHRYFWVCICVIIGVFAGTGCVHSTQSFDSPDPSARQLTSGGISFWVPSQVRVQEDHRVDFSLYNFFNEKTDRVLMSMYVGNFPMKDSFDGFPARPTSVNLNGSRGKEKAWIDANGLQRREMLILLDRKWGLYVHASYGSERDDWKIADAIISSIRSDLPEIIKHAADDEPIEDFPTSTNLIATPIDFQSMRQFVKPEFSMWIPLNVRVEEERRDRRNAYVYRFLHDETGAELLGLWIEPSLEDIYFEMFPSKPRPITLNGILGQEKRWLDDTGAHHREMYFPLDKKQGLYASVSYATEGAEAQRTADLMISTLQFYATSGK